MGFFRTFAHMKTEGYKVKEYGQAVKRYVQTMDLKDDAALIAEYRRRHSEPEAWKEVLDGIRAVGILDMQLLYGHLPAVQGRGYE